MSIVFLPVTMPADLAGQRNGKLGPCQLSQVFFPGLGTSDLHPLAARAWNTLAIKVLADTGKKLTTTGGGAYRTYAGQLYAFNTRMTLDPSQAGTSGITRTFEGKTYYLKPGYSPVAAPEWYDSVEQKWKGGSNHGWGLAIDAAIFMGGVIRGITADAAVWASVQKWAPECGFSWEGARPGQPGWEPWHIRYVAGDNVPQTVLDVEAWFAAVAKG